MVKFQHTAARRRLPTILKCLYILNCFNTQPHGGGCFALLLVANYLTDVSTHSRTEAAACNLRKEKESGKGFNTQPHGGGCRRKSMSLQCLNQFQHTAARRRLLSGNCVSASTRRFNTQPHGGGCSLHKKVRKISELNTVFR